MSDPLNSELYKNLDLSDFLKHAFTQFKTQEKDIQETNEIIKKEKSQAKQLRKKQKVKARRKKKSDLSKT